MPPGGQYLGGQNGITAASTDDDLEFVVFTTADDILGIGTPPGVQQVYRWQRSLDQTILVSVNSYGSPASASCYRPTVSNGGRWVVFDTAAALVPGDTNGQWDVYARILGAAAKGPAPMVVRLSVSAAGAQGNGWSRYACVAGDDYTNNMYVVFTSAASNLVPGDQNARADVFRVHAWVNPGGSPPVQIVGVVLVSVNDAGAQSFTTDFETACRVSRSINAAGDKIVFSGAPCDWRDPCIVGGVYRNCLCPDPDGECEVDCEPVEQIYLREVAGASSRTHRVSRTFVEGQGFLPGNDDSQVATISPDAFLVAWSSTATNFPGDADSQDVFLMECCGSFDHPGMNPLRVSQPLGGNPSNGHSAFPLVQHPINSYPAHERRLRRFSSRDGNPRSTRHRPAALRGGEGDAGRRIVRLLSADADRTGGSAVYGATGPWQTPGDLFLGCCTSVGALRRLRVHCKQPRRGRYERRNGRVSGL